MDKQSRQNDQHVSIGTCMKVWVSIVVLVAISYVVFLLDIEPLWLKRVIFIAIALAQAALSVTYFMQLRAERPGLVYAVVFPVSLLFALIVFGVGEGDYVWGIRQAQQWLVTGEPDNGEPDKNGETANPIEKGMELAQSNGCLACHSVTGEKIVGPTWKGLYGSQRELESGATETANEAYLRTAIVNPSVQVAKGYPPAMPPFTKLTDEEIDAIIAYIKSLSTEGSK
jgi:caa(3)-type oxidase subunit IV